MGERLFDVLDWKSGGCDGRGRKSGRSEAGVELELVSSA